MLLLHLVASESSFLNVGVKFDIPLEELPPADFTDTHAGIVKPPHY